jgi:hypothetical protein
MGFMGMDEGFSQTCRGDSTLIYNNILFTTMRRALPSSLH